VSCIVLWSQKQITLPLDARNLPRWDHRSKYFAPYDMKRILFVFCEARVQPTWLTSIYSIGGLRSKYWNNREMKAEARHTIAEARAEAPRDKQRTMDHPRYLYALGRWALSGTWTTRYTVRRPTGPSLYSRQDDTRELVELVSYRSLLISSY
jgi:hypothetical protein